jgi:hypothetical protein
MPSLAYRDILFADDFVNRLAAPVDAATMSVESSVSQRDIAVEITARASEIDHSVLAVNLIGQVYVSQNR